MLDDWFELGLSGKMKKVSGAIRMQAIFEYGESKAKAKKTIKKIREDFDGLNEFSTEMKKYLDSTILITLRLQRLLDKN
mgnify:CR=1 FL=1